MTCGVEHRYHRPIRPRLPLTSPARTREQVLQSETAARRAAETKLASAEASAADASRQLASAQHAASSEAALNERRRAAAEDAAARQRDAEAAARREAAAATSEARRLEGRLVEAAAALAAAEAAAEEARERGATRESELCQVRWGAHRTWSEGAHRSISLHSMIQVNSCLRECPLCTERSERSSGFRIQCRSQKFKRDFGAMCDSTLNSSIRVSALWPGGGAAARGAQPANGGAAGGAIPAGRRGAHPAAPGGARGAGRPPHAPALHIADDFKPPPCPAATSLRLFPILNNSTDSKGPPQPSLRCVPPVVVSTGRGIGDTPGLYRRKRSGGLSMQVDAVGTVQVLHVREGR